MSLAAGTRLGPYEITAQVGAGGMGEVYRAKDTRLGRVVAIKTVNGPNAARFEREARALATLNHPHICQLYDVGPNYLVMELVDGKPLKGPLPPRQAVAYALQICEALEAAHRRNIIHRDLKPGNILVTPSGVKVLDFGLAKITATAAVSDTAVTAEMTAAGTVLGTAGYMSPEQARGEEADARSDIFSLGLVLYEMLSGRGAFSRRSAADAVAAILRDEPPPLEAPPSLCAVVSRCLEKVPSNRFQTVSEVRQALEQSAAKAAERSSIAVLPFVNMSGDKDNEYFSDGLAEEIINALAQMPGLKVIARTSAFAFRGKEEDIRKIAETLGVSTILEGSVRRAGNRIRVTAQLIEAENGSHLWSERYDREMSDIFAMQDEIATAIASALQVKLAVSPTARRRYTPALPAYEAYLRARHHWAKATPDGLQRSREFFERAVALDPEYALAYIGLADYFLLLSYGSGLMPAHEAMPRVRELAQQALAVDPGFGEAQAMLGIVAGIYDHQWTEAERWFAAAMSREPISPVIRTWYGHFLLLSRARFNDATRELQLGLREDPLNSISRACLAYGLGAAGRHEEAIAECRRILEVDDDSFYALASLAWNHLSIGAIDEALPVAEKAYRVAPWSALCVATCAAALRLAGGEVRSRELLRSLRDAPDAYGSPRGMMLFHALCKDEEQARNWAVKAVEQRDHYAVLFGVFFLRSSPYWPELAGLMNLRD